MVDPSLNQAIAYLQWHMLRGASDDAANIAILDKRDYDWMSNEDREIALAKAREMCNITKACWEAMPHLKPELTIGDNRRTIRSKRPPGGRPNR